MTQGSQVYKSQTKGSRVMLGQGNDWDARHLGLETPFWYN